MRTPVLLLMSVLATCALLAVSATVQTSKPNLVGEWVTIQTPGFQGKEFLTLQSDGRFVMRVKLPNKPEQTAKGKYQVKEELPPGSKSKEDRSLYLTPEFVDGTAVPKNSVAPKKMGYYAKGPILTDVLTLVFCRPGDEEKIKKMFSAPAKGSKKP